MKKVRFFLAMIALILAIGGALASQSHDTNSVAYEYISTGLGSCTQHTVTCFTSGTVQCTVSGSSQLRETNVVANTCGQLMWKN